MKQIILCADDYGQNFAISQGIVNLVAKQRLSAVSCITSSSLWPSHAHWLLPYIDKIDIGLHFNLTMGPALAEIPQLTRSGKLPSLATLLIKSHLGKLDKQAIAMEFNQQLEQFVAALGKLPDFIDGHQHIHHLPIVRDVILEAYDKRLRDNKSYIRNVSEKNLADLFHGKARIKRTIIQLTGAKNFNTALVLRKIPHNLSFAGIYNFANAKNYAHIFPPFLAKITHAGLIMCHPGIASTDANDPIYSGRHYEYDYFASEQFIADCQKAGVELARFGAID